MKLKDAYLKFRAAQFNLARWLLHLWVRPTILGCNHEHLNIAEGDLVCYALPLRSIADLLIVDMACEAGQLPRPTEAIPAVDEARAFFFVGRAEGRLGRRSHRLHSERMTRLLERQQTAEQEVDQEIKQDIKQEIKIVPVSLFWGHQPDREKSIFSLLLSENWRATGLIRRFLAGLFYRSHILVQFSTCISLRELAATETDSQLQVRKLTRLLRVHFNSQKRAILGPDLSHRRTLLSTMLASPLVKEALQREARQRGVSLQKVQKKAMKYATEIASDQSYRVVRFFDVLLTWLWNNLYDGIEVSGIDKVKQLAQTCELIYTPCHRSHIDYLLLSYVLYHNGLTPPHIAAGENLNLPLIGPILRRAGGFFMRRSFKGDALYKAVFDEYLHQMFTRGYSVEYFIEGSRSRTGRTLQPRLGMLNMTLGSFRRNANKPIAFLPVYLGYERVLEASTYMAELSGKDKQSESMFDMFKVFSSFRRAFGKVTVNFGTPVLLQEFLDQQAPGWQEAPPETLSASSMELARRLATNINSAVTIKATSLTATALLATTRQNIEEEHLKAQLTLLAELAEGCGPKDLTLPEQTPEELIATVMDITGLSRHESKFGAVISASPAQAIALTYNANNIAHVYVLPSLVARYLRAQQSATPEELLAFITTLFSYLNGEMFLGYEAAELEAELARTLACMDRLHLTETQDGRRLAPPPASGRHHALYEIASIAGPTLERFYIVMALLQTGESFSLKQLEVAASGIAEQLSALYGINSPDFFERSLFASFLNTLRQEGLVSIEDGGLIIQDGFAKLEAATALTLPEDVRYNILQTLEHTRAGDAE
ncbi:MAG: glycerol-3-phosphate 1-O-acyltransferase PlsB [Pseudomonadales bacterium]